MKVLTLAATLENMEQIIGFIGSEDMTVNIAIEEIFVNICNYAYAEGGDITIRAEQDLGVITIEFEDSGTPYNPLEKSDPEDLDAETSEDKNVGGYGIYMVRQMMDSVVYRHENGKNILTITKNEGGGF